MKSKQKTTTLPNPLVATIAHQQRMRSLTDTNIFEIAEWAKEYHEHTAYPCTKLQRFVVSFYQLSQGFKWNIKGGELQKPYSEYESFAASILHMFMVGAAFDLCIADDFEKPIAPEACIDLMEIPTKPVDWQQFTILMSALAQQVFYGEKTFRQGYSRKSRFKPLVMQKLLAELIVMLTGHIPSHRRSEAIEQASTIMTERL